MLSRKAKYALKAMTRLASLAEGELGQAGDIAARENIPKKFLDLILIELRRHRLVTSYRGQQGGYILAKPASEITLGQIVRIIDGPLAPIACASVTAYRPCPDCNVKKCPVRMSMRKVRDAASGVLDNLTLEDALETDLEKRPVRPRKELKLLP